MEFNIRQSSLPSHPGRSKGDNSIGCIYRAKRRFVARRNYYCAKEFESGAIRNHSWSVDQKMYEDNVSSSTRISLAQERNGGGGKVVSNENSYSDSITEKSEGNLFIQVLCFAFFHSFFFTYLKIKDNFFFLEGIFFPLVSLSLCLIFFFFALFLLVLELKKEKKYFERF